MKTHLISSSDDSWEEVDQQTYDHYIYNRLFEMSIDFHGKAHKCIMLIVDFIKKFGDVYQYKEDNRQKLTDIKVFLQQCNESYILRSHHIKEEMQFIEQKYRNY